jgi:prophage antirepressor-like protein
MQHALTFGAHEVKTITREGQLWMSGTEVGRLLEYASPEKAIKQLYNARADEFTTTMTRVIKVMTAGGKQAVRFFSLRGAHLLGMFARTPKAKDFRVWILNILGMFARTPKAKDFRVWILNILDRETAALKEAAHAGKELSYNTRLALQGICTEVYFMASWWRHFGEGIKLISPHAYNLIYERFLFAPGRADELVKEFDLNSRKQSANTEQWEYLVRERRKEAKFAGRYTECAQ